MNGFLMLFVNLAVLVLSIVGVVKGIIQLDATGGAQGGWLLGGSALMIVVNIIMWCGLMQLERACGNVVRQVCRHVCKGGLLLD